MPPKEKPQPVEEKELPSRKDDPSTPPLQDPTDEPYKAPPQRQEPPKEAPPRKREMR